MTDEGKDKALYLRESEADLGLVERKRESARQIIALTASGSMFLIVVLSFISLWCMKDAKFEDLREILHILIPPAVGIFGAVTGFYFGERNMG